MEYKDALGPVSLPADVLERLRNYVAPEPSPAADPEVPPEIDADADWHIIRQIEGSKPGSWHAVEQLGNTEKLRCTCQDFKIRKRGYCKHTKRVAEDLGF